MKTMEILLVEDNAGDAVLIRQILADASVPVNLHIVRDGEQALTMLSDAHFRPSLDHPGSEYSAHYRERRCWSAGNRRTSRWSSLAPL